MTDKPGSQPVPRAESLEKMRRERCLSWKPREHVVRIVDRKHREWLVYDATDDGRTPPRFLSGRHAPSCGSSGGTISADAIHPRRKGPRDGSHDDWQAVAETYRADQREEVMRSAGAAIQDIYDSRRGMGRR
jgi:hypothetical protein